ncbi:multicopper oxidase domain-containing protein [Maribellus comscasis]|uniref:Multicopper oxidase domain-containing protein n=1 Tax=Maribellus comscasis TaxID=2681766 RepID=A0A6I6K058_9BACT|nr:multicopper oxidase family protein [Maribellus comscasis]QGY45802.1 multicopper oxidase domain-containing protein [Maribellus comscasis]
MNRKEFLQNSAKGVALTTLLPSLAFCTSNGQQKTIQGNYQVSDNFKADVDIELTASQSELQLFSGNQTRVYSYQPKLLKGEKSSLEKLPGSYLGPVIRVQKGQKIRVRFNNQLSRESVIHWHGLHIPPEMDGHPMYAIENGEQYIYEFEVNNQPGTYWFHPHPDKITGPQVYQGLAGLFIVEDNNSDLPSGEYDVPLILQDRIFDDNNQLVYLQNNRMGQMQGFLGNRILMNGNPDTTFNVSKSTYRFRVLNGSNSRIYKMAWDDGEEVTVIGTDGGLLEKPVKKPYLMLAPGQRAEIWKDFAGQNTGTEIQLQSLAFNDGTSMGMGGGMMGRGMMGGMTQPGGVENGIAFDVAAFKVTENTGKKMELPSTLSTITPINPADAVNSANPRQFYFYNQRMQWVINGETFGMTEVAEWEKVKLNTTEIWEFINGDDGRGMGMMQDMMRMPHPVHLHGLQFQIIDRDVSGMERTVWETVKDGFMDEGWQDTFLLLPGMKVKIIMRFKDFTGLYVYHCHNLEHEDMGMMRNYEVID